MFECTKPGERKMFECTKFYVTSPEQGNWAWWGEVCFKSGESYESWNLTSEPQKIFEHDGLTVLKCTAHEHRQDEHGVAAMDESYCHRQFLICLKEDQTVVWWFGFYGPCYDLQQKRFFKNSITIQGKEIIFEGYNVYKSPGKNIKIYIDVETGTLREVLSET